MGITSGEGAKEAGLGDLSCCLPEDEEELDRVETLSSL